MLRWNGCENEEDSMLDSDPSESVTMGALKDLLLNLQENINSNTDRKIKGVKQDVTYIKSTLDKFSDRFEEAETRIGELEDRAEKYDEIGNGVEVLRDLYEKSIEQAHKEACNVRKNNMIINGLPGNSKEVNDAWKSFVTLCNDDLELGDDWLREAGITEVYRFPAKKKTDPWPLFVKFGSTRPKDDMFKAAPKLKKRAKNTLCVMTWRPT